MIVAYLVPADGAEVSWYFTVLSADSIIGLIVFYCKAVRAGIKVDAEPAVVGGVGGRVGHTDDVAADDGARLVRERIDTSCVVELAGIVANSVTYDAVILHTRIVWCPSPADADA